MGELIITTSGLLMSIASIPEAVGIGIVILCLGAAGTAALFIITRYTAVDIRIDLSGDNLVSYLS